ncbi:MAG: triple tyrosine motif-containing protein [Bacteroidetes bacterium]|nr:triple tyrosine motif-containing protein [Bacteroidota bacterium]
MISKLRRYWLFGIVIAISSVNAVYSQRFGLPWIHNFNRAEYAGGTQNWAVAQALNGMMYFGNNNGLVEYDGAHWTVYSDLQLVIRSLCIDDKRIYVGAFNKFGYYEEDANGILKYNSLLPLLKNRIKDFDEIWRIHKTSFGIVFQSFKAIFIYNGGKIDIVSPISKFHFSYYVNGILWVHDELNGLMQYREGKLRRISDGSAFAGTQIWTILPLNDDEVIIGTAKKGMFRFNGDKLIAWDKPINAILKKYQIFSGALIDKKYFAFGTIQNGLIISDTSGQVVFEINKERGLSNNTVLCVGSDQEGNIWLGLDNGISVIHFNSPLTFIQNYFNIGSGYASAFFGGNLYLGTNQGLFYIQWKDFINPLKKNSDFHLIEGTEGQVWCLTIIDNTLLCGHHLGVFQIQNKTALKISSVPGGWNMIKPDGKQSRLLVGNYAGISVFGRKGNLWEYRNELSGYDQSSHYIEQDSKGFIWISHGYKGLFRLKPDADLQRLEEIRFYDSRKGLPSDLGNTLFKLKSGIAVGTRNGIYRYNENADKFEPDIPFNQLFSGLKQIDYLSQDSANNIWYYNNQQLGVLRFQEDGAYTNIATPFVELSGMVIPAFGHVNTLDAGNAIIGLEGGFAHYNSAQYKYFSFLPVLHICKLQSSDTSEGVYRFSSACLRQEVVPRFRFVNNTITIAFSASQFAEQKTSFQFKLEGFDDDWSAWSFQNAKEYTNLPVGDYTFKLKALTVQGKTTPALNCTFKILPPWYRTIYAWIIYFLITIFLLYFLYRIFLKKIEKSHIKEKEAQKVKYRQREQELKEKALITEAEMISLRNEKLNLEMIHKEKELANSTMLIIQKNEILHKLRNELNKLKTRISDDHLKDDLNITVKKIGKEIDNEKQWQVFNTHVEQVHEELFKKLKTQYSDLTPRELSLCAYLRMNISSKEIATLMNISARGVEISRYRIRKKLGLDRNANLTDFMMSL